MPFQAQAVFIFEDAEQKQKLEAEKKKYKLCFI